jgi:acylphosphatase
VLAGPAEAVAELIAQCRRGPSSAHVDAVQDEDASSDALNVRRAGERFSVLGTI